MAAAPQFVASPSDQLTVFTIADGTTAKTVFTVSATEGSVLRGLLLTTDRATDIEFDLLYKRGGTTTYLVRVVLPGTAGRVATVPPLNVVDPVYLPFLNQEPNRALYVQQDDEVQVKLASALVGTDVVHAFATGGSY